LNGEGEIVAQWSGKIDPAELRAEVESLIESSP
jgi:hypothetical protein